MKTNYTPGPWRIVDETYILSGSEVIGKFGRYTTHPLNKIDQANARLVAAAPELLEALYEAEAGLEFAGADKNIPEGHFVPSPTLALRAVRKAIAKATGEKEVQS
jgi:hypothetical protein